MQQWNSPPVLFQVLCAQRTAISTGHSQKGSEPCVRTIRKEVGSQGRGGGDESTVEPVCLGDSVEAGVTAEYTLYSVARGS